MDGVIEIRQAFEVCCSECGSTLKAEFVRQQHLGATDMLKVEPCGSCIDMAEGVNVPEILAHPA